MPTLHVDREDVAPDDVLAKGGRVDEEETTRRNGLRELLDVQVKTVRVEVLEDVKAEYQVEAVWKRDVEQVALGDAISDARMGAGDGHVADFQAFSVKPVLVQLLDDGTT